MKIFQIFFPQSLAGFCGKLKGTPLCKKCELKIKEYMISEIVDYSKEENNPFNHAIHMLKYQGLIREKILQYKFDEKSYLYKTFSKIILNNSKIYGFLKNYDIIVPVPMSKNKFQSRGYNQTELISKDIAKNLGLKHSLNNLIKIRETKMQSTLNFQDRIDNVKNAFCVTSESEFKGKKVILFDDIFTTGSTVVECSKILKKTGAKGITVLTIAKD